MESPNTFFSFQKLLVWQKSRELVKRVYAVLELFPQAERFSLADQLRRAVISVPSNIAERPNPLHRNRLRFVDGSFLPTSIGRGFGIHFAGTL